MLFIFWTPKVLWSSNNKVTLKSFFLFFIGTIRCINKMHKVILHSSLKLGKVRLNLFKFFWGVRRTQQLKRQLLAKNKKRNLYYWKKREKGSEGDWSPYALGEFFWATKEAEATCCSNKNSFFSFLYVSCHSWTTFWGKK